VLLHIEHCAACRDEWERTTGIWSLLSAIPEEEPNVAAMQRRFDETLAAFVAMPERESQAPGPRNPRSWLSWRPAYATAAMVFLMVMMFAGAALMLHFDRTRLAAAQEELRNAREMLALALMQQSAASERIRGVSEATRLNDPPSPVVAVLVDALLSDPNVNVRLACLRALGQFHERPAIRAGVSEALLREQSPLVATALISFVVDSGDLTAIETLRRLSQDPMRDSGVRDKATEGLQQLLRKGQL